MSQYIHSCYTKFIKSIPSDTKKLILLGDLFNKGKEQVEQFTWVMQHRFDPKFFGAFITPQSSAKICSKIFSFGRRVAGRTLSFLGFYEPVKRFIGFRTAGTALIKELREEEMKLVKNVQVVPLRRDSPDLRHRIIYTIARAE